MIRGSRADGARLRQELRGAQRALEDANAKASRLRAALDAVPVGIVVADEHGRTLMRNRAASMGGHADLLIGDVIRRLVQVASESGAASEQVELFGPPKRVLLVRAAPMGDGETIVTIDDQSERARLDAVRTDFVSNISHELKTPVGALALLAETLEDNDDPEVTRRLASRMVTEAHRAGRTIDDLLDLSRIELGGQGDRSPVVLGDVLGDVAERHRLTSERTQVALQIDTLSTVTVLGDRLQLVSAVSNLVDNAVKYSNPGGTVRVTCESAEGVASVHVADEGVGIPQRDLDRIFERFYRVDRARSRETGGTGLGLAIVRHVANNHGGEVTVQSREGEGSVFTLRIPMEKR